MRAALQTLPLSTVGRGHLWEGMQTLVVLTTEALMTSGLCDVQPKIKRENCGLVPESDDDHSRKRRQIKALKRCAENCREAVAQSSIHRDASL